MKYNYGSNIEILGEAKGTKKNKKYTWIASASSSQPTTIRLHKNLGWWKIGNRRIDSMVCRRILPHETIHNIIWTEFGLYEPNGYDIIVRKFRQKNRRECPKTFMDWDVF